MTLICQRHGRRQIQNDIKRKLPHQLIFLQEARCGLPVSPVTPAVANVRLRVEHDTSGPAASTTSERRGDLTPSSSCRQTRMLRKPNNVENFPCLSSRTFLCQNNGSPTCYPTKTTRIP